MSETNSISMQMRADWNQRAREDAYYYVAFGRKGQDDEEFFATAADVVRNLEAEMKHLNAGAGRQGRALEIGCGPGRLMRPMSWNFAEVHGVDVSDEMIRLASAKLHSTPNTFPRHTKGTDLGMYSSEYFDFVYSYAVFQHIPSREVVFHYLAEARRVLKPGGILRCQINGLPQTAKQYTTWEGARIGASEVAEFACVNDMQLLALDGVDTQYLWVTLRKQPDGWFAALEENRPPASSRIRSILNAHSGEPAAPSRGRYASLSLWMEQFPRDADLNQINVTVDGAAAAPIYVGPPVYDGLSQLNVLLPPDLRTGLVPVEVLWFGEPIAEPAWTRIITPPPSVPRMRAITDGVNLLSGTVITSRTVKLTFEELATPERFQATIDGVAVEDQDVFCTDPMSERFEINFTVPSAIGPGAHRVEMRIGSRLFPPVPIEVRA